MSELHIGEELKRFIEENIDLIDTQDIEELYNKIFTGNYILNSDQVGTFTKILYDTLGIDVLSRLTSGELPEYFLFRQDVPKNFHLPQHINSIGLYAFARSNIDSCIMPPKVTVIPKGCFCYCDNIDVIFFNNVSKIGAFAFKHCDRLQTLRVPEAVKEIGEHAFAACHNLCRVELPDNVQCIIKEGAFSHCPQLTDVIIPQGIKLEGKEIFKYCNRDCTFHIYEGSDADNYFTKYQTNVIIDYILY